MQSNLEEVNMSDMRGACACVTKAEKFLWVWAATSCE